MILINKQIQITGGISPYTFVFTPNEGCVSVQSYNQSSNVLDLVIAVEDETCFDNTLTLEVRVIDAGGICNQTITLDLNNPCEDFTVSSITSNELTFTSSAFSPSSTSLSFIWEYNEQLFNLVSQLDSGLSSTITLEFKNNLVSYPTDTEISTLVTNEIGCTKEEVYTYTLCIPTVPNLSMEANCVNNTTTYSTGWYDFELPEHCVQFDYNTLNIDLPSNITYEHTNGHINFTIDNSLQSIPQYSLPYTVSLDNGITSNTGLINISLNACSGRRITGTNRLAPLSDTTASGGVIDFPLSQTLQSVDPVDYTSFQLLNNTPVTSPSIQVETRLSGDRVVAYTVPTPKIVESFQFVISDTSGVQSDAITYTYVPKIVPMTLSDETICLKEGASDTTDYLLNDLGDLNPSTFNIVTQPTNGTYTMSGTTITYNAPSNFDGTDVIEYEVTDVYGETQQATITYTIINTGTSNTVTTCTDGLYNFYDLIGGEANTGGTWVSTGGGGPIPAAYNDDVDLTGFTGLLEYEYTVTVGLCTFKSILNINKSAGTVIPGDECAGPRFFSSPSTVNYTDSLVHTSQEACPVSGATLSSEVYPASWSNSTADVWYFVNLSSITVSLNDVTITLSSNNSTQSVPNTYTEIAMYSSCGTAALTTTDTFLLNTSESSIVFTPGNIPSTLRFRVGDSTRGNTDLVLTIV